MQRPQAQPDRGEEAQRREQSCLEEARRIIEEYADDLREVIKKLRQRLH
ncbi:hypothetical protein [Bradyrhizobium japonicum]|nr:hypothetical protein [Bradyrhizobium japonicum]